MNNIWSTSTPLVEYSDSASNKLAVRVILSKMLLLLLLAAGVFALTKVGFFNSPRIDTSNLQQYFNTVEILQGKVATLDDEVNRMSAENRQLRREVELLTTSKGVIDQIISRIKEMKEENRKLLALIQPQTEGYQASVEDTGAAGEQQSSALSPARHMIVTPRPKPVLNHSEPTKVTSANSDKPAKDASATQEEE